MKLKYGRTILIGLAFMSICAFWQMYDNVIPLILTSTFGIGKTVSGVIMGADNVLALFLLPLIGAASDKTHTKIGRRMPYIVLGTLAAIITMNFLPIIDNAYFAAAADWMKFAFIGVLGVVLLAMASYRSPAVALMPDLTEKPLRSKANAVINLMGAVGGVLFLIITTFMYSKKRTEGLAHIDYQPMFLIVAGIMLVSVAVLFITIKEPKIAAEVSKYEEAHPEDSLTVVDEKSGKEKLPAPVKKSLIFLLCSIALWFFGYNAVTTWFTSYATTEWNMALGDAALCLTIATVGAIVSYIPIGLIASKIGRKRTILAGIILLTACFTTAFIYTLKAESFSALLYGLFALVGLAWAAINVNSLPMVVEMCSGSDIGKFTGYYYTFSMAAQTMTPMVSGALMEPTALGNTALFPYGAVFVALSFVTMLFVKHGDNKPKKAESKLEMLDVGD